MIYGKCFFPVPQFPFSPVLRRQPSSPMTLLIRSCSRSFFKLNYRTIIPSNHHRHLRDNSSALNFQTRSVTDTQLVNPGSELSGSCDGLTVDRNQTITSVQSCSAPGAVRIADPNS